MIYAINASIKHSITALFSGLNVHGDVRGKLFIILLKNLIIFVSGV
jgi:hypothetical protein